MTNANSALFRLLYDYCSRREDPVRFESQARYVSSNILDKDHLKGTVINRYIKFDQCRILALLTLPDKQQLIGTIGFEFESTLPDLEYFEASSGIQVALISDIKPQPTATTFNVRNIVEFDDMSNPAYHGHQFSAISELFPKIRVWKTLNATDEGSVWQLFLMLSVEECKFGASWIGDQLSEEITALAQLHVPSLPYRSLCQSIFDLDPRSLFMALYRCIEATYAYESCRKLIDHLSLDTDWQIVAQALATTVNWRPQEASSLQLSLHYALDEDLERLRLILGAECGDNLRATTGRAIYDLRNRIVHYRPWLDENSVDDLDWNLVCIYLVRIVLNVFHQAFAKDTANVV